MVFPRILPSRFFPPVILTLCVGVFAFPSPVHAQSTPAPDGGTKTVETGGQNTPKGDAKPVPTGAAGETGANKAPTEKPPADKAPVVAAPPVSPSGVRPTAPTRHVPKNVPLRDRALDPKCAWMGERVVSLLARDDVDMAERFLVFYTRFDCPAPRIAEAFDCVIRSPVIGATGSAKSPAAESGEPSLASVTSSCWTDPTLAFSLPRESEPEASPPKK